jgi:hypothetical protein
METWIGARMLMAWAGRVSTIEIIRRQQSPGQGQTK